MGRHEQREQVFLLLFREAFYDPADLPDQVKLFLNESEILKDPKDREYVRARFEAVMERLETIDRLINDNTQGWNTHRIGKVELAVLRLAVYELRFDDDIPAGVAINEAVEIAKKYGQDNAGGFVNAILAKILKLGD